MPDLDDIAMGEEAAPKAPEEKAKKEKKSLPKLPHFDLRWILVALFVAGLTVANTVLVMRFSGPKLILQDPRMQSFAGEGEKIDEGKALSESGKLPRHVLAPSMITSFNMILDLPKVDPSAYLHRQAFVCAAEIGPECYIGPQASVRADIGQGVHLGAGTNVQDGAVITGLPTEERGMPLHDALITVGNGEYSVYLGERVTLAPQAQVHGPALIGDDAYLGMQTLVFRASLGKGCVLEPRAAVLNVRVPDNRYVPAGKIVQEQAEADQLPTIPPNYFYRAIAAREVKDHIELVGALHGR